MPDGKLLTSLPSRFVIVFALVASSGCSAATGQTVTIPTLPSPSPGVQVLCTPALHTPFTLEGDRTKSPPVWGVDIFGRPFPIVWPPGFTARFTPGLEIVDPGGTVVARAGTIRDAVGTGDSTFYVCGIGGKVY